MNCNIFKSMDDAALKGHLKCLQILYKDRCRYFRIGNINNKFFWTGEIFSNAIYSASLSVNIQCLQFLQQKKCPINELTIPNAVKMGNKQILKYLYSINCPWNIVKYDDYHDFNYRYIKEFILNLHQTKK